MSELTHLSLFSGIGGLDLASGGRTFRARTMPDRCDWRKWMDRLTGKHYDRGDYYIKESLRKEMEV